MSSFTLPSGHEHHFRERSFRRSFLVSLGIHLAILVAAGSATLFHMKGATYSPSYTVDLVALPPSAEPAAVRPVTPKPAPAPEAPKAPETPKAPPKSEPPPAETGAEVRPDEGAREILPSGGDEAARSERRRRIEELEREARRLYESYTAEESGSTVPSAPVQERADADAAAPGTASGGASGPTDIRFRAYYDRIWAQIRSAWVLPEGIASEGHLVTVVGIRISGTGNIEQSWIENRSGNQYYDQSALRAVRKANPLPPLPEGIHEVPLEVGINFRYPE